MIQTMEELSLSQADDFFENQMENLMNQLRPGLPPLWGRMTPQHAVEHLAAVLKFSNGSLEVAVHTPPEKLPKYRQFLFYNIATVQNYKSPILDRESLPPLKHAGLDAALEEFWNEWDLFKKFFESHPFATPNNAVFGPLTYEEWRRFHFKHIVHHLTQFGVTTNEAHGLALPPLK
jgi:hypothetical protein